MITKQLFFNQSDNFWQRFEKTFEEVFLKYQKLLDCGRIEEKAISFSWFGSFVGVTRRHGQLDETWNFCGKLV